VKSNLVMERMIESDKFGLNNLNLHKNEFLYHLDISCSDNLPKRFGDVKVNMME